MIVQLSNELAARGYRTALVVASGEGPYRARVQPAVELVDLGVPRVARAVLPLAAYLRQHRPRSVLATMNHANVAAVVAMAVARSDGRLVVREANCVGGQLDDATSWRTTAAIRAIRFAYPRAHQVVAVSQDVADDLVGVVGVQRASVQVIYNPIDFEAIRARGAEPLDHPFFQPEVQVKRVVSVGRLAEHKEHATLLRAFARVLEAGVDARLVILGEGGERARLEALRAELGIGARVDLPGFRPNPFAFMARADVVAHTSRREGLPNVLIQSVALGARVVATEAQGAREALEGSELGCLVPVGDVPRIAEALVQTLRAPKSAPTEPPAAWRARFELSAVVDDYARALGLLT